MGLNLVSMATQKIYLFLFHILFFSVLSVKTTSTPRTQAEALVQWKRSFMSFHPSLNSWSLSNLHNLCNWTGISCDSVTATVSKINMASLNITGKLQQFNFTSFVNLTSFDIMNNTISGLIPPAIGCLSELKYLDLSNNFLEGNIPAEIGQLMELQRLNLSTNSLTGIIPRQLTNLHKVRFLDLGANHLETPGWTEHSSLPSLTYLSVSRNKLTSEIPRFISNCRNLTFLDLSWNYLSGELPLSLSNLNKLTRLILNDNSLSGEISSYIIGNCTALVWLQLENNFFSGSIPPEIGLLTRLRALLLHNNTLSGPIPMKIRNLKNLTLLNLSKNQLSGLIPSVPPALLSFKIDGNRLEGELPRSLANCSDLEVLDVANNMISDTFPFWLMELHALHVLILRANKFYGRLENLGPVNLFPMLHILDLSSNEFTGHITPEFLQSLMVMMGIRTAKPRPPHFYLVGEDYYYESLTLFVKGREYTYARVLFFFCALDLSKNRFNGKLPEEIGSFVSLIVLNLSRNAFVGDIPPTVAELQEIESLDLSWNQLSGEIPPQVTSLVFLAFVNFSYNQFEGTIPLGMQFNTFSADSYAGNPRLCGPTLTRICGEAIDSMPRKPVVEEDSWIEFDWKVVLMGYGCGLLTGFAIGLAILRKIGDEWMPSFDRRTRKQSKRFRQGPRLQRRR